MLKHADIWQAIDALAAKYGLSPSGLARSSGLDPTTFNKSKRTTRDGKQRWPSTESIAKILAATGASLAEFVALIDGAAQGTAGGRIPLLTLAQAQQPGVFDAQGRPSGQSWDSMAFPQAGHSAYGLEVRGDGFMPSYREGDVLIVSPDADLRRGDRVLVRRRDGAFIVRRFVRNSLALLELAALDASQPDLDLPAEQVAWTARILWASQ